MENIIVDLPRADRETKLVRGPVEPWEGIPLQVLWSESDSKWTAPISLRTSLLLLTISAGVIGGIIARVLS